VTSPSSGKWDNPDLEVYCTRIASFTARTPTRAIPTVTGALRSGEFTSNKKVGTIIGVTLGSPFFLALLFVLVLFFLKCLKRRRAKQALNGPPVELENTTPPIELSSSEPKYPGVGYSPHSPPPQSQGYFHNQENDSPRGQHGFQVYEMGGGPASRKAPITGLGNLPSGPWPASPLRSPFWNPWCSLTGWGDGCYDGNTTWTGSAGSNLKAIVPPPTQVRSIYLLVFSRWVHITFAKNLGKVLPRRV
jgi:hypothetical protein